jgi:hypothetical protein
MKLKKNIALSESGFVFDPGSGNSFTTNPIGLEIIQLLKEGEPREKILEFVLSKYEVSDQAAERDLEDFIKVLERIRLLENETGKN